MIGIKFRKIKIFKKIKTRRKPLIAIAILAIAALIWLFWGTPLPGNLSNPPAVSTKLFDRNGELIYEIYANERRTPVLLESVPDHVVQATLSIEDKDFYKHHGFSITGIARAFYKNIFKGKTEGGSTLTQQLVKNSLLSPERTLKRKIKEFALATIVEIRYSKDQILEMYLNQIPYGSTAYGIAAASELYLDKKVEDLSLAEATLLAGLPAAPTRYSPFGAHPERAKERQKQVLRRMVEDGHISQEEADKAYEEEIVYAKPQGIKAPHFALWVKEQLAEKYGDTVVEQGGLRVVTTLDLKLQEFVQNEVATEVGKLKKQNVGNGAALVTNPKTGEILAMVGSKDYFAQDEDGKVNIIFAKRQPGSSIKPLNYALAIKDKKITASTALADIPTCFTTQGQEAYCPVNYDGNFHGSTQVRFALGNSYNIPAVRVLALNGLEHFIEFARELGITTFEDPSNYGLSLTLGGGEVKPFDMAVAYSSLANEGIKKDLISITKIDDWKGKTLFEKNIQDEEGTRVFEPEVGFIISHILHDNNARKDAFGESSFLNVSGHPEVSVKTGTTNDRRDNWTIGYNQDILSVVWVGNNDNTPMSGAVSGVSGASPIWNKIMKKALEGKKPSWQKQPSEIIGTSICATTGAIPEGESSGCPTRFEYFLKDTVPNIKTERRDFFKDKITQKEATKDTAPENMEPQGQLSITDPLGTLICLTCPFPQSQVTIRYPIFTKKTQQ